MIVLAREIAADHEAFMRLPQDEQRRVQARGSRGYTKPIPMTDERRRKLNVDNARRWAKLNPAKHAARNNARRARKMQAMPKWANEFFIKEAYALAQLRTKVMGFKWHVDHIVPLTSKVVCGLHTHDNLQVIPMLENSKKSNRWWPDMWDEEAA